MSDADRPLVAPPGGFALGDIAKAYVAGARDGREHAFNRRTSETAAEFDALIERSADAYVKSVAVPMEDPSIDRNPFKNDPVFLGFPIP